MLRKLEVEDKYSANFCAEAQFLLVVSRRNKCSLPVLPIRFLLCPLSLFLKVLRKLLRWDRGGKEDNASLIFLTRRQFHSHLQLQGIAVSNLGQNLGLFDLLRTGSLQPTEMQYWQNNF